MKDDEILLDLLLAWEERLDQGQDVSAEEICQKNPELIQPLKERIQALKSIAWIKKPVDDDSSTFTAPTAPDQPRKLAGRYRLDKLIGEGGFAQVWKGFDLELHRAVAVKTPKPSRRFSSDEVEQFIAEARRVARLRHPGIVAIHDIQRSENGCFFISDLIDGTDLAGRLRQGRLSQKEAVPIVAEVARILAYAHAQGFIHRDIKPGNILLDTLGQPHLCDFGIAVADNEPQDHRNTLPYASPEQITGQKADARSDIYSLGVVLFELLAGRLPCDDPDPLKLREMVLTQEPPLSLIPTSLQRICSKCLSKKSELRYSSAQALADDLDATLRYRLGWTLFVVGGAVTIILAAMAMVALNPFRHGTVEPKKAPITKSNDEHAPTKAAHVFYGHVGSVNCVAFHPQGNLVASGGADATVRLWKLEDRAADPVIFNQTTGVNSLAFTADGNILACGLDNGNIQIWEGEKKGLTLPGYKSGVTSLAFSSDEKFLASGGKDGIVRIFVTGEATGATIPKNGETVLALTFSREGRKLTTAYGDGPKSAKVLLSEIITAKGKLGLANHAEGPLKSIADVRLMAVSKDGDTLLAATVDAVHVWRKQGKSMEVVGTFSRSTEPITALALSHDSRFALSCGGDNLIRLWDVSTLKQVRVFAAAQHVIRSLAFSSDGSHAVSGDDGSEVRLWKIEP